MPARILVLSASVGAGHTRAAQAVELAVRKLDSSAAVKHVDALDFTNATFRRLYARSYFDLVNRAPHVLGYFYDLMDRPPSPQHKGDRLRLLVEKLNLRPLLRFLRGDAWDVFVNTHFLPAEMIASLRRHGELDTPQLTVTTDFETHRLWVNEPCERYFTATDEGAAYLAHWGVPTAKIRVSGIPIHPVFAEEKDRAACRTRHGLARSDRDDRSSSGGAQAVPGDPRKRVTTNSMDAASAGAEPPVVLQLAGGFGVGPVEQLYRAVLSVELPLQVVVVCGRNDELLEVLRKVAVPKRHRSIVLGFTTEIDELMAAADLVISKPGGLTTSEALARGVPMVVVNPIPGQETRNADYLLENGAAVKVNHPALLAYKLTRLLGDAKRLESLRESARRLARPRAAFDVAREALAAAAGR